jgi:hypothetical protein
VALRKNERALAKTPFSFRAVAEDPVASLSPKLSSKTLSRKRLSLLALLCLCLRAASVSFDDDVEGENVTFHPAKTLGMARRASETRDALFP